MRVMTGGPLPQKTARTIMAFFYGYFLLHWLTGTVMFAGKLGFSPTGIARYYRGDPEAFINPRSFAGLLEVSHFHLFAMGLFFVVVSHLLLFTPVAERIKSALVAVLATALLLDIASGWLVRYVAAGFAWLKLAAFLTVQGVSLLLLCGLLWGVWRQRRAGRR